MKRVAMVGVVVVCAGLMFGCTKEEAPEPASKTMGDRINNAADAMKKGVDEATTQAKTMVSREQMDAMVKGFNTQLANLQTAMADPKAAADAKLKELIGQVQTKLGTMQKKLTELNTAEGGTVDALQAELTKLAEEVKPLLEQAAQRLNELTGGGLESLKDSLKLPGS